MFQNLRLLFLRFFIAVREINYLSCFIVFYDIKLRKMCRYPVDYAANSALLERIRRVFVLRGYLREHRDDIRRQDRRKFVRIGVGQDCIWIFLQITQNLVRLTRNTHIVLRN